MNVETLLPVSSSTTPVNRAVLATGVVSTRPLSRVEYRKRFGLTNAESKRKHAEYLLTVGRQNNGALSKGLASGDLVTIGVKVNPDTGTWSASGVISTHKSLSAPAPKEGTSAAKVAAAEAKLAALAALLAKSGLSQAEIEAAMK